MEADTSEAQAYAVRAPACRDDILRRLRHRLRPHRELVTIVQHYQSLLNEHSALRSRHEHDRVRSHTETTGEDGNSSEEITRLKVELSDIYRLKALNDQKLIDANASVIVKDKKIGDLEAELGKAKEQLRSLHTIKESLGARITEEKKLTQHVRDEHLALHATFNVLEAKYKKSQEDNAELVQRWMALKATQADQVNADNELAAKKAQTKLRTDLEEAASSVVTFVSGHVIPYLEGDNLEFAAEAESPGRRTTGPSGIPGDVAPSALRLKFSAHSGQADALCWSSGGSALATGATDRKIKLWRVDQGKHEKSATLLGCNQSVTCVDFDFEDRYLLAGCNDFAVRLWTVADQRCRDSLTGHSGKVYAARFYSQCTKAASGGHDRTIKIWDLRSRRCERTLFAFSTVHDLVASEGSGASIISGHFDRKLRLWDARSHDAEPTREIVIDARITSVAFTRDRQRVLCCARDDTLRLIDLRTYDTLHTFSADDFHVSSDTARAALSPESSMCACGSADGSVYVWNAHEGKLLHVLHKGGHDAAVTSVSWHPLGHEVASADKHGTVCIWSEYA